LYLLILVECSETFFNLKHFTIKIQFFHDNHLFAIILRNLRSFNNLESYESQFENQFNIIFSDYSQSFYKIYNNELSVNDLLNNFGDKSYEICQINVC